MKLAPVCSVLSYGVLAFSFNMDPNLQKNIPKFGYGINYKYEGQISNSVKRSHVIMKFQLLRLNNISMRFRRMPVDYKKCDYLS